MIKIVKGDEPEELKRLRETAENQGLNPKEAYELLNADRRLKKKIKRALVKEQGGLCAYCMCRIPRGMAVLHIRSVHPIRCRRLTDV